MAYYTIMSSSQFEGSALEDENTVPQSAEFLSVSEETVRRNIRAKRLAALQRGTQWFVRRDVLVKFSGAYNPKTGKIRKML